MMWERSILFVAAENFFVHDIRQRWRATFVLGLVHGFGFAGALREYELPQGALVAALAAFNVGVEIGQVLIVAFIFPLLLWSDRIGNAKAAHKGRHPALVYTCSAVILVFGLYLLIERTCSRELYGRVRRVADASEWLLWVTSGRCGSINARERLLGL
jgi:hypothetical protein